MSIKNLVLLTLLGGVIGGLVGYGSEGTVQAACGGAGSGMIFALFAAFFLLSDGS